MSPGIFTEGIIYSVSNITAGVFLIVLIVSVTLQTGRRRGLPHLFAAAIFMLAGIFGIMLAGAIGRRPDGIEMWTGADILSDAPEEVLWTIAFALISLGIIEAVTHVIYINEGISGRILTKRHTAIAVIAAAGTVIYALTKSINVYTAGILAEFCYSLLYLRKNHPGNAWREFLRASAAAVITFAVAIIYNPIRLTGLGLSLMLIILGEQYHNHIMQELSDREEALAKSRVKLLIDQIEPHYIYNSLQSIRALCETDPRKARDALDSFSEYLRGNIESLTAEELIPFARELELTQAYLELEELTGRSRFTVKYELGVTDFMLPPLVLQPVVENAVKHGASKAYGVAAVSAEGGSMTEIVVSSRMEEGCILIGVTDKTEDRFVALSGSQGNAQSPEFHKNFDTSEDAGSPKPANISNNAKKRSVGLENVRTRLAIQCGGNIELESIPNGTKVTISLPVSPKPADFSNLR